MVDTAVLSKAVGAHGAWKQRLAAAIQSGTDLATPDKVRVDNACDFGKWLYGSDAATKGDPHYAEIKDLHARFHLAAADVLALALAARKAEAEKAMGAGSPFAQASAKLTIAMGTWIRAAG